MKTDKTVPEFTAFLRPEFTALLTAKILTGESLNLISPHGQGRRRTLHDLRHNLPKPLQLFHFNMRNINVSPIVLPPLSNAQLLAELRRRDGSKTTQQLRSLSATLLHQSAPYSALEQLFPI